MHRISRLPYKLFIAIWHSARLNGRLLMAKIRGRKTFVVCIAEAHLIHMDSVLRALIKRKAFEKVEIYFLTDTDTIGSLARKLPFEYKENRIYSALSIRFLVLCDLVLTVWEGQVFPYLGCRIRLCVFHNQPVKGITFASFNYKQINALFLYGPLMRDLYLRKKNENPKWPEIACYETGQPLSDRLFIGDLGKKEARRQLALDQDRLTVIYAPTYEYCSSLATHGEVIINTLLEMDVNLIVRPHPMFYISERIDQGRDGPIVGEWRDRIRHYNSLPHCIFPEQAPIESAACFAAADIMVTDYSSIAFDGILRDMGMIYWHCPLFYSEYLPKRYGMAAEDVLKDLSYNAGRDSGIVVHNVMELKQAVARYRESPEHMAAERAMVKAQLLFNPGHATEVAVDKLEELLGLRHSISAS